MLDFSLSEEQKALVDAARRFANERILPIAAECDRDAKFPREVFEAAHELGLVNATIPKEFGGVGLGELDNALVTEQLAYACTGIEATLLANTLAATPIKLAGSQEQKHRYFGALTSSPIFASCCTSEPRIDGDPFEVGVGFSRHGDEFVLTGKAPWTTNPGLATFYVVFATSETGSARDGMAAFIVDRDTPGLTVGAPQDKLGQRASQTAAVSFHEVKVTNRGLLAGAGYGLQLAADSFEQSCSYLGAMASGLTQRCLHESVEYARERRTFGVPIGEHPLIQSLVADMAMSAETARLLYLSAAWGLDRGASETIAASCAKAVAADRAIQTALDAVQVLGGNGYAHEYPVEKLVRDAKTLQIDGGTGQTQRSIIAKKLLLGRIRRA